MKKQNNSAKANNLTLPPNTPVLVKAYHKLTGKEIVKQMTLGEWYELKKSKEYFYRCLQV